MATALCVCVSLFYGQPSDPPARHIEGMKSELIKYHALLNSIKPLDQRKDAKGKDTFTLSDWWRCNSGELPHFAFVLRALLTNAPNSCLPDRLFSMLLLERIRRNLL